MIGILRGLTGLGGLTDPSSIPSDRFKKRAFRINKVNDLSDQEIHGVNGRYKLSPGSFSIGVDLGKEGASSGEFVFSHSEDIKEIL